MSETRTNSKPVFLNRGYTYLLWVRSTKTGGTKHQIFFWDARPKILTQAYKPRN